ncbi:hypothetical protein [Psychroserpens sp. BH13MA-6]
MRKILIFGFLIGIQFIAIGQNFVELKAELIERFPNDSIEGDNVWAFFEETANIKKIIKPTVKKYLNEFDLYQATLTNFLGYHIEDAECLIIYNPKTSELEMYPPIWFDNSMEKFFTKFYDTEFESKAEMKKFISQIQEIMLIGSLRKSFENTEFDSEKITFNLMETRNSKKKVWKKMEIKTNGNRIIEFMSDNPANRKTDD